MERSRERLKKHIDTAIASLAVFDQRALPLRVIAKYIMDRKS
jgi:geranylgeranyl diphosphate synthase type II